MLNSISEPLLKTAELENLTKSHFYVLQVPTSHVLLASPWLLAPTLAAGQSRVLKTGSLRVPEPQMGSKEHLAGSSEGEQPLF